MKMRNGAILTAVLILAVFISSSAVLAQGDCEVPGDLRVIVTEAKWEFDLKTGRLSGEATVRNICDSDVVAPGISVGIFGAEGQMVNNVAQRGAEPRLSWQVGQGEVPYRSEGGPGLAHVHALRGHGQHLRLDFNPRRGIVK